jgi:hypothetical protein
MPARKGSKHALLEKRIESVELVDETVWETLKRDLAPISESYLRHLIKQSGHPMTPIVEGVNMSTREDADRTLQALAAEYESGDPHRRKLCRALVLETKERIRWQLRRSSQSGKPAADPQEFRQELLLWVSTWLENPAIFPEWIAIRRTSRVTEVRTIPPE